MENKNSAERLAAYSSQEFIRLSDSAAKLFFSSLEPETQIQLLKESEETIQRKTLLSLDFEGLLSFFRWCNEEEFAFFINFLEESARSSIEERIHSEKGTAAAFIRTQFASLSSETSVDEAIAYFRELSNQGARNIYYAYVLDKEKRLLGIVPFKQLFLGPSKKLVGEIMTPNVFSLKASATEEEIAKAFSSHRLIAIPVLNDAGQMVGIVTANTIVSMLQEEATEDIQKLGGMEALDAPYWNISFLPMLKKRAGWLMVLFLGEMFTATAMGYFSKEIEKAVVLALFIPLIISSGGNAGSQATTLIIRAMALHEIKLRDWWRVFFRELASGLALGVILGTIGLLRILLWPTRLSIYGEYYAKIALTVSFSLVGIVLWGTLIGSMLPFVFRKLGFDPASASAPFVATAVDVTGLIIYFSVATLTLSGTLL